MSGIEVSMFMSPYDPVANAESRPNRPEPTTSPPSTKMISFDTNHEDSLTPIESDGNIKKPISSLQSEFERLFHDFDYETIQTEILNLRLTECRFYTVLWRIFLHCLPRDASQWNDMLSITRNLYIELERKYDVDPREKYSENGISEIVNHPLSQHPNSDWQKFHDNNDFKRSIRVDVCRTYPNVDFFRDDEVVKLLTTVLFTHSRHHRAVCDYRQGMHEILGMIVYTLHTESLRVYADPESTELMKNLYDPRFLRHDSYSMFEKIMFHLRQYYTQATNSTSQLKKSSSVKSMKQQLFEKQHSVPVEVNDNVLRMKSLFDQLDKHEPQLYKKLTDLGIEPTVFGIRWLRLMFGREIPFESIPILWNVILCFDESFTFVNHFFIALLKEFKQPILALSNATDMDCLHILMKPNIIVNIDPVMRQALRLAGRQIQLSTESAIADPIPPTPDTESMNNGTSRENPLQPAKTQRIHVPPSTNPRLTRPQLLSRSKNSAPSLQQMTENRSNNATKINSKHPFPTSEATREEELDPPSEIGLALWLGRTAQQQYDEKVRLQKCCAQYMTKFVGRLERLVSDLVLPNEDELLYTISGLKQIAHVLDGQLDLDDERLQTFLKYQSKNTTNRSHHGDQH